MHLHHNSFSCSVSVCLLKENDECKQQLIHDMICRSGYVVCCFVFHLNINIMMSYSQFRSRNIFNLSNTSIVNVRFWCQPLNQRAVASCQTHYFCASVQQSYREKSIMQRSTKTCCILSKEFDWVEELLYLLLYCYHYQSFYKYIKTVEHNKAVTPNLSGFLKVEADEARKMGSPKTVIYNTSLQIYWKSRIHDKTIFSQVAFPF